MSAHLRSRFSSEIMPLCSLRQTAGTSHMPTRIEMVMTPYTAGKLIEYLMDAYVKDAKADNDKLDPDHVALYQEMTRNIFNATQFDSAVDSGTELCGAVASNAMNIQQAIETYEPVYTKMAQNANKKMAKKQEELKSAAAAADAVSGETDGE